MTQSTAQPPSQSAFKTILLSGVMAAALDILLAILWYDVVQHKTSALPILQSIASAVYGKAAYEGGIKMALYGLGFHFFIAFCFATAYYFICPCIGLLRKHTIVSGIIYGIFIWMIMNLVVLPIAFHRSPGFTWRGALPGIMIIILAVGLPIAMITGKSYYKKDRLK
ncbi:MAG TPA: hypothetical protein VFV68_05215 [Agriterribacter sp.]|nr:hypothetical protein [Agriterribacter sp.]